MKAECLVQVPFRVSGAVYWKWRKVGILVAEDEPLLAQQLAAALSEAHHVVDCAHDGAEADFLATTEAYDAIVLDLGLPKIDGLSLLRRWREAGLAAPILVLTARGSWHEKVQNRYRSGRLPLQALPNGGGARTSARSHPPRQRPRAS